MPEKSNASRCVPRSFKIEAAQVVAARRRAGGAWLASSRMIKSRQLWLCAWFCTARRGARKAGWKMGCKGNASRLCAPGGGLGRALAFLGKILSRGFRGRAQRRGHDMFFRATRSRCFGTWTCSLLAAPRCCCCCRPSRCFPVRQYACALRASVRSSEGPQTSFKLAAVRHQRALRLAPIGLLASIEAYGRPRT